MSISTLDPTKIHIRASGATDGGVTLSSGEHTTGSDSPTLRFTLTPANLATVLALTTPQLQFDAATFSDTGGRVFPRVFDVRDAAYSGASFSTGGTPSGIHFNPAGTLMFVTDTSLHSVQRFTLNSAFDVSTATHGGHAVVQCFFIRPEYNPGRCGF